MAGAHASHSTDAAAPVRAGDDIAQLHVRVARSFLQRARGLLLRRPLAADEALLIPGCAAVHTFGMRYTIDVVFVDPVGRVLRVVPRVSPWRIALQPGAAGVLELAAGRAAALGFGAGARLASLQPLLAAAGVRHAS